MKGLQKKISFRRCIRTKLTKQATVSREVDLLADLLEVAGRADVCFGQPLLLPFAFFLPPGEGRVHNVVHLRVVVITLNTVDLRVFDVDSGHGQRRSWGITK